MPSPADAQESFLCNASLLLKAKGPSTSAHIMSENLHSYRVHLKPIPDKYRSMTCAACGTSFGSAEEPGSPSSLKSDLKPDQEQRNSSKSSMLHKKRTRTCQRCGWTVRSQLPSPPKLKEASHKPAQLSIRPSSSTSAPFAAQATPQQRSKHRAKLRKTQDLQHLLENSKKTTEDSGQLDLMDFLRT